MIHNVSTKNAGGVLIVKKMLEEVFLLRAIACLSIVLLHSITRTYTNEDGIIEYLKLLLAFGTPAFVFISELVLAHSYPVHTPKGFLVKRIRYILLPYFCFSLVYLFSDTIFNAGTDRPFIINLIRFSFLGEFSGYFVLIIFQFYLLHLFFQRYIFPKFRPITVLSVTALLNFTYLGLFNLSPIPSSVFGVYMWERLYTMIFVGWIFYFAVAYYCGRYYKEMLAILLRWRYALIGSVLFTGALVLFTLEQQWINIVSSKRMDMVLFTLSMVFMLLFVSSQLKRIPDWIVRISQTSFGIYLIHPIILSFLQVGFRKVPFLQNSIAGVVILMISALLLSIAAVYIVNYLPWGSHVIGKIGVGNKPSKQKMQESRTVATAP